MDVLKTIDGEYFKLKIQKIKEYKNFSLYQVYKVINGKEEKLYKETFDKYQLQELRNKKYTISEEIFE